jgi:rhodanese-related sulfurtransferase
MHRNSSILYFLVVTLLLALLSGCSGARGHKSAAVQLDPAKVPTPYHTLVDIEFVKPLVFEAMLNQNPSPKAMIIDARPKQARYDKGHIPTAVSMPDSQFDKMAAEVLPADKNTLLVFYCGGLACPLSHQSAWKAEGLGYTNVKVYAAGDPEWESLGYEVWTARDVRTPLPVLDPAKVTKPFHRLLTLDQVKPYVASAMLSATPVEGVMIIDSRPKQPRYDKGHIPTAVSLPDSQFDKMASEVLPADKTAKLIFYCGGVACPLSHQSAWKAEALGYTNVAVYPAGDPEWVAKGLKVWTAEGASQEVASAPAKAKAPAGALKAGASEGSIDNDVFAELARNNVDSIRLIDARSPAEFAIAHIPGSENMTVDMLEKKIDAFTADKPIVFICTTGARSGEAFYMFQAMRPDLKDVYYVDANVSFAPDGSFTIKK